MRHSTANATGLIISRKQLLYVQARADRFVKLLILHCGTEWHHLLKSSSLLHSLTQLPLLSRELSLSSREDKGLSSFLNPHSISSVWEGKLLTGLPDLQKAGLLSLQHFSDLLSWRHLRSIYTVPHASIALLWELLSAHVERHQDICALCEVGPPNWGLALHVTNEAWMSR